MSVTQVDHIARLQQEMAAITKPLSDHYAELERTIAGMETELNALRKARTQLRQTLRAIDPELVPTNGKKKLPAAKKHSGATLKLTMEWLSARRDEIDAMGGIHASGIVNGHGELLRPDWDVPITSQASVSAALRQLHDQGFLRLDHLGNGGARYFKVV
jgi:hypothetical protein